MAKHDRCTVCDYSEAQGSNFAGIPPGKNGKVRRFGSDFLCDSCHRPIADTAAEFEVEDNAKEKENDLA